MTGGLTIAVLGLGFGQDFVPIYLAHPDVERVVLVEPDAARRAEVADRFGLGAGASSLDEVLGDDSVDAVHMLPPVHFHADYAVRVLEAGKHCASAVPAATTLDDLDRVIAAERASGRRYMMMETSVYGREYFAARRLLDSGRIGTPTLYQGVHIQNLDGFPVYWQGFPPMHYLTHALSPALALLDTTVVAVQARGAGRLTPDRATGGFENPFPTEVGLFELEGSDMLADITMSFFQTGRSYIEGFSLYGDAGALEWPVDNEGDLLAYDMTGPAEGSRGNRVAVHPLAPRDEPDRLPEELHGFVREGTVQLPGMPRPVLVGAAHSGSHPYLVHEFVSSIVEERPSAVDAKRAAAWTAPGICAHQSALRGGERVEVPQYPAE